MKKILILLLLFLSTHAFSQKITILYLNSPWNTRNDYQDLDKLYGVEILKVSYEDQPPSVRQAIRSVPAIIIFEEKKPVATFQADISMKLNVRYEDIQKIINDHKSPRRASTN